ncbi:TonB-dependent receptor [Flexithrix dorotheae]|uniref:TonB-dependent receptor n=1 Tax=Flexithrix dorotheae TaxID=70993 RepID=UPI000477AA07|nr:TonB-dependent receptor [Flexithrix dorotheae]
MRKNLLSLLIPIAILLLANNYSWAQGTTTARINGLVSNDEGPLPGAAIIAIHTPTGSKFGGVTNVDGIFTINNLNVGGPYKISASYIGFQNSEKEGIYLSLGQTLKIDFELTEESTELEMVEVIALGSDVFDGNRTGPETNVTEKDLTALPTVNRSLNDFFRLSPQANLNNGTQNSISFAGVNNRYNSIFIDGAVNNDVFGLASSGTNGGQTGISPISIDALEQVQLVVAPYDVTLGGFAGGGINAVTRSGTNNFEGSAYYFTRNQNLAGKTPTDDPEQERVKLDPFTAKTYGFRLGGPIIKNKLFFFVNAEIQRDETPVPFTFDGYEGDADKATVDAIAAQVQNLYGYDPGGYENNIQTLSGDKFLLKLDYNINQNHKLSARHSYTRADFVGPLRAGARNIYFGNSGQTFPSITNSSALELKSNFGSKASNNLIIGATFVRDDRNITGQPFPSIVINDGNADITLGGEPFSYANVVNQDVITLTNNFNLYKGKHTFTIGTHNEFFSLFNLFLPLHPSQYTYSSTDKFFANEAYLYLYGHEKGNINIGDNATSVAADFSALQLAFYGQDEIQFNPNFKLTAGIRLDIPIFIDNPPRDNTQFNTETVRLIEQEGYDLKGARASQMPATQLMWSPRVGFNWDIKGDKTTQLRGGLGIFTSRVPFVWPGGVFLRNGLTSGFYVGFNGAGFAPPGDGGIAFEPDLNQQIPRPLGTGGGLPEDDPNQPSGDVDLFTENFKYPQIFRGSIGVDQRLFWGLTGSLEFQYTKTLNNVLYQNLNIKKEPFANLQGADNRPIWNPAGDPVDPTYNYITLADNTNKGWTYSFTAQLQKAFDNGFTGSLAYTYTDAKSIFDGTVFINSSQWQEFHSVGGRNNPDGLYRSQFASGSRVVAFLNYRKEYLNNLATSISVFYNGQSGIPYSYVYNDNDGTLTNNDPNLDEPRNLIYVPASQDEIVLVDKMDGEGNVTETAAQQWAALDAYISNDDYLSERRGNYAERNAARTPFESIIDVKFQQEVFIETGNGIRHTLAFTFDIFNFGNLLNKDWGRRYFISDNQNFQLIQFQGYQDAANDNYTPTFTFSDPGDPWNIIQDGSTASARWSAQIGLRYSF